MSKFTSEMIDNYAEKLLIGLTKDENQMVLEEFDSIDVNLNLINNIPNINKVIPMTHCLDDFEYVLREDDIVESVSIDELFSNADEIDGNEIQVPKVVG